MTTPVAPTPSNDEAWSAFMGTHAPTGQPMLTDGPVPWRFCEKPNLLIDAACPHCGRADHWHLIQVVGETPGIPEMPAQGSGVVYRCGMCGKTRRYRERPATDQERAERMFTLLKVAQKP